MHSVSCLVTISLSAQFEVVYEKLLRDFIFSVSLSMTQLFLLLCLFMLISCISGFVITKTFRTSYLSASNIEPRSSSQRQLKDISNSAKNVLVGGLVFLSSSISAVNARSFNPFPSAEQSAVDDIGSYQKMVHELLDLLKPTTQVDALGQYVTRQTLKDTLEDANVVENYKQRIIIPLQVKMEKLAPKLFLDAEVQKRVETLPLLMKGHIAELSVAVKQMSSKDQAREVEEVKDTLEEFLQLASSKYEVDPYVPSRFLTDKELFGPLGCEFWGKRRVIGSNACEVIENAAK